jgi:hypothetical protein
VAISLGRVTLAGIFDPFEVLQGLWPWCMSPKLGSLILLNAFLDCNR